MSKSKSLTCEETNAGFTLWRYFPEIFLVDDDFGENCQSWSCNKQIVYLIHKLYFTSAVFEAGAISALVRSLHNKKDIS